ncbi:MAG: protein kinase, partial [Verrucomicrobiota bacterium]
MAEGSQARLAALMFTDIVGSVALQNRLGTEVYTNFVRRHDEIFKRCLEPVAGAQILNETGDGFLVRFDTPTDAVNTALRLQAALHEEVCEGEKMELCIGLHLGAVTEMEESVRGEKRAVGMAINLAARVMDLAEGNQILMTRAVFDDARQFVRVHPEQDALPDSAILQWPAHGRYLFKGNDDPIEIYEVGAEGMAPLSPPEGGNKAKRAVAADEEDTLGWRPGAGIPIPRMEDWIVQRQLGQGGFGEVWLAEHLNTKEQRVFKFCFDPERLRSFRRELTLFRLLRDALGKRSDIAALYDVSIEMPPFYLESEFVPQGNLVQWIESTGGMENVSMETRLDILARAARATDAAHSVGIVHKDIKPSNILMSLEEGQPRPRLGDFGIGAVTDASALSDFGITQAGFTQSIVYDSETGSNSMTQLYAPPEYLVGGAASPQGDIYSLGVMLYQLVVGDLKRPLASGWQRDVSDPLLADIIEKCIDVDPHRRFESAGQIAERLETLEERREQLAEKEHLEQMRGQAKKRRRFLAIAGVTCLALIGLTAYFATNFVRQKRLTEEAERLRSQAREMASHSDYLLSGHMLSQDRRADGVAYLARSLRNDPSNKGVAAKLFATLANSRLLQPIHPPLRMHAEYDLTKLFVASFDSTSSRILAPDSEGMLTISAAATGELVGSPFDHRGETLRTAQFFRDDAKVLAVTMESGIDFRVAPSRLRVWDTETGKLEFLSDVGQHLGLGDDSSYWMSAEARTLAYWDLQGETIKKYELPRPEGERFQFANKTRDGEKLVCVSVDGDGTSRRVSVMNLSGHRPEDWKELEWEQ